MAYTLRIQSKLRFSGTVQPAANKGDYTAGQAPHPPPAAAFRGITLFVNNRQRKKDRSGIFLAGFAVLVLMFVFSLPDPLFSSYYSPVLLDRNGRLLGAVAAYDGQWRFPEGSLLSRGSAARPVISGNRINEKFAAAIIEAEDRRFRSHAGVDFFALGRAFLQNAVSGKTVSGGSTLTMQTIRLARPGSRRTVFEKALEAVLAMRLELSCSKDKILALYAANAPFGANVVGIEAASWRWFGRSSEDLSWTEAATLAVLPNSPGLIHPGRNRERLREKRDALLERLYAKNCFDRETFVLARAEALPGPPRPLPNLAPHLLARLIMEAGGIKAFNSGDRPLYDSLVTTIDYETQERAKTILDRWALRFADQGIMNGACVILDTESGETLAYAGNVNTKEAPDVDIVRSRRSSGSLLKPFLYAAMLDSGDIFPASLVSDIPTRIGSYSAENSSRAYLGVIPANEALARSLNVPAVRSLRLYGIERFAGLLRSLGITTLFRRGEDYGLPLILGGAEITLWEITGLYAGLARAVNGNQTQAFFPPRLFTGEPSRRKRFFDRNRTGSGFSPGAAWLTLEALTFVTRPGEEAHWQEYAGSRRIAWKTGTSFGSRDAWAVGTRPDRTVGVWIGNASGEGRPELLSAGTSAPVLFEIFSAIDAVNPGDKSWFTQPAADLVPLEVCSFSGFPARPDCAGVKTAAIPRGAPRQKNCPYCRAVVLNENGDARVVIGPDSAGKIQTKKWFVLPPAEEWYYRRWNFDYRPLPPLEGKNEPEFNVIALFNPEENGAVYVPREIDGREGRVVFQAASRKTGEQIFWHLDDTYLGMTEMFHEIEARPLPGSHVLTLVDSNGNTLKRSFEVLGGVD